MHTTCEEASEPTKRSVVGEFEIEFTDEISSDSFTKQVTRTPFSHRLPSPVSSSHPLFLIAYHCKMSFFIAIVACRILVPA